MTEKDGNLQTFAQKPIGQWEDAWDYEDRLSGNPCCGWWSNRWILP